MSEQRERLTGNSGTRGSAVTQGFVFLGGPFAWVAQLVLSYFIIAVGCDVWSPVLVQVLLYLTSVAALVVTAVAGVIAYRAGRGSDGPLDKLMEGPEERPGFFSVIGMLSSLLFFAVILASTVGVVLMSPCS